MGHQLPPATAGNNWCMSKQLNVVPLATGQDVLVASYAGGGTSVVDFTDPAHPFEIASYADGAGTSNAHTPWASYWYDGHVYSNNAYGCFVDACFGTLTRGLDVLALDRHLPGAIPMRSFNAGLQE